MAIADRWMTSQYACVKMVSAQLAGGELTVANASSQDRTSPPSSRSPDDLVLILMISSHSFYRTPLKHFHFNEYLVEPVLQSQGGNFMSASARYV